MTAALVGPQDQPIITGPWQPRDVDDWTDDDSTRLTAALVILDGHHMPLTDDERAVAVQLGVAHGLDRRVIADRLGMHISALYDWCRSRGIQLPPPPPPDGWASYGRRPRNRRRTTTTKEPQ